MKKEQITKEQAIQRFETFFDIFYFYHRSNQHSIGSGNYFIGRVMLLSFACETGLKAMAKYEGGEILCTHKLDVLFENLKSDTQKILIDKSEFNSDDFYRYINKNNSCFEEWRYYKINIKADLNFLESLLRPMVEILLPEKYKSLQRPNC